ncbi:MAG: single-stranded-DNA-specific exonuclease RecJ, partial [Calothrix sp. SM1_7_51]|nr:single-stranded-DNA-specific exonuclease RecJ [Calothrix sp. SM1_7_51]
WHRNQQDWRGKKVQYIKAEFDIGDDSTDSPFPGVWWGHYKEELPTTKCDCIAELDYNTYKKRYEIRLIALRPTVNSTANNSNSSLILDYRNSPYSPLPTPSFAKRVRRTQFAWREHPPSNFSLLPSFNRRLSHKLG